MESDSLLQRQASNESAETSQTHPENKDKSQSGQRDASPSPFEQKYLGRFSGGRRGGKSGETGVKRTTHGQHQKAVQKSALASRASQEKQAPGKPHHRSQPELTSKTSTRGLPSQKSANQLQRASTKTEKEKGRLGPGGIKRAVSLTDLQPEERAKAELEEGMGRQSSASRRLLQRLTFSTPAVADKAATKLPSLAPVEKKILAAVGQRDWIKVDSRAEASLFKKDKHAMTHELGIQIRDLRLLDPLMTSSYPSCLLCRDKALIVNLEYIKCIVTTTYVLILDADQLASKAFIKQLQKRIKEGYETTEAGAAATVLGLDRPSMGGPSFELKALETALDEVTKHLEKLSSELEVSVRPMLGTTTSSKVTSAYLEKMRRMKTRLVRLRTRVETMKEMLEKYLDDEDDMKSIHLSAKLREQKAAAFRRLVRRSLREHPQSLDAAQQSIDGVQSSGVQAMYMAQPDMGGEEARKEVSEVEMLLEAYYMNLDSTWNKLTDIAESFDDAEELMDLEMDSYRNNILRMKVFLGACHLLGGALWAISNIFGMNVGLVMDDLSGDTYDNFVMVSTISTGAAFLLLSLFTFYLHRRRLAVTTITS